VTKRESEVQAPPPEELYEQELNFLEVIHFGWVCRLRRLVSAKPSRPKQNAYTSPP
jgi:hypothetical protein